MTRHTVLLLAGLGLVLGANAAQSQTPVRLGADRKPVATVNLYPAVAPGSEGWTRVEQTRARDNGARIVRNIVVPTLEVYLPNPDKATGAGVIVAPGGGLRFLSYDTEGVWVAQWLAEHGIAGFVLKYRVNETAANDTAMFPTTIVPPAAGPAPASTPAALLGLRPGGAEAIGDGLRALQLVRERAREWGVAPERLGFMGFSAGAYVTTGVVSKGGRPAFAAPIYGGNSGDRLPMSADAPPMFLAVAADDNLAYDIANALYDELRGIGKKPEFHIYHAGGHGFGIEPRNNSASHWIDELYWWMQSNGWLKSGATR